MIGRRVPRLAVTVGVAAALGASGCGRGKSPAAPPPEQVTAYAVEAREASVPHEFVGQVSAAREVTLQPQVTGYLKKQVFQDGARVRKGDLLFVIDPRPFRAALAQARAQLANARSALAKAERDVARYEPLVRDRAVAKQMLDDALAARRGAAATVEAQQAAVEGARLSLAYTDVRTPLDGRIGRAQVYPGALVNAGQTVLASVSTIDPVDVYFGVSEIEYLKIAEYLREPSRPRPRVELVLADGSTYPRGGHIDFVERAVLAQTGTLGFRAEFPNPDELLRPGMFARVRVFENVPGALLVPSRAIVQVLSSSSVVRVGPGDVAEPRPVELGALLGPYRIIRSGLQAGDRVVVDGVAQARPGVKLAVKPITDAQIAPPQVAGGRAPGQAPGAGAGAGGAPPGATEVQGRAPPEPPRRATGATPSQGAAAPAGGGEPGGAGAR